MKALVIAPHTDDGELGCGGTISRLVREGNEVHYMCFSSCGVPELYKEMQKSIVSLGVADFYLTETPVRKFHKKRQDILDFMIGREFDLVFCPSSDDVHQDHQIVNQEARRAFKRTKLLGYELPWNSQGFKGNCFWKVSYEDIANKIKALSYYRTQSHRTYFDETFTENLAYIRGVQAGCKYAECFEVIKWYE